MSLTIKSVSSPQWANAAHTAIDCDVEFEEISSPMPYTATANDPEAHGQQLWDDLNAEKYGPIAAEDAAKILAAKRAAMSVSSAQAQIALHNAGKLDEVETAISSASKAAQIAWAKAQFFERNSPTLAEIATTIGMSDTELDSLFEAAAQIQI